MKAAITIDMDNAAFEDNPHELETILRDVATTFGHYGRNPELLWPVSALYDSNGNRVGTVTISNDSDEKPDLVMLEVPGIEDMTVMELKQTIEMMAEISSAEIERLRGVVDIWRQGCLKALEIIGKDDPT